VQLPLAQRLKLARQRLYAALGVGGERAVTVHPSPLGAEIEVDGRRIAAPSPLRWKLYRKGLEARLDRLEREYGVGRLLRLGPQSVIIDVGANAGEFALVAARHGAQIHCIEPDPSAFACLVANTGDLPGVIRHEALLWKETADVEFGLVPERADSSVFADAPKCRTMRATTLADLAAKAGISRADLLKCDAEGAEPEVLAGAGEFLSRIGVVAVDTGPERRGARTHSECAEILAARGFRVTEEKVGTRWMTYGVNQNPAGAG